MATDAGEREQFYDQYWKDERVTDSPHQRWKIGVIRDILEKNGARSVLDVGAGDGAVLSRVAPTTVRRVGADLADDALRKMEARGVTGVKADLEEARLPFADGEFDAVMCLDVLEHLFAPERLLAEIRRVTNPRGIVIVAVPNAFNLVNRVAYLAGRHLDVMDVAHRTGALFSEHIRFFSEPVLDRMLDGASLTASRRDFYFPDELTDNKLKAGAWLPKLVRAPRLHERLPSLFALAFLVTCRVRAA